MAARVARAATTQAAALEALVSSATERAASAEERSDARLESFLAKVDQAIEAQAATTCATTVSRGASKSTSA